MSDSGNSTQGRASRTARTEHTTRNRRRSAVAFRPVRTIASPARLEVAALAGALALAALLRFGWPGVNSFAFDEARLSLIALRMARDGQFAALGMPSSVNVPNLPAAAWIFSIPYFFSPDPLLATLFVGLLSLLAVCGVWLLARRAWGAWAGLAAALFMAASPYGVLYARNIWAQNLLVPLALGWGWAAYYALAGDNPRRRSIALALHVFLAGFALQVHFAGAALALGTLYLFLRHRWWRRPAPALIGSAFVLITLAPFVIEVACCAPDVADQFRALLASPSQLDLVSWRETIRLALGREWGFLALGDLDTFSDDLLPALIAGVLLMAGLIVLLRAVVRRGDAPAQSEPTLSRGTILAELTIVWLVTAPLFFVRHSTPVFIHYQLASLPALALVVGASTRLRNDPRWAAGVTALAALLAVVWGAAVGRSLERAGQVETPNGLGTPLAVSRDAAYELPEDAPVLFFTHGDDPALDGEVAVFDALWWERERRIVQGESLLILPPDPAYLMATLAPFQAWEELQAAGLVQDLMLFERREGALPFVAVRYDGQQGPAGFTAIEPVRFADGTQLEGWRARRVGPRLRISTLWRVVDTPPPGIFRQFHHLYTGEILDDEPFAISDVPLSNHNWRAGDRLVVMGDFFVETAAEWWVEVGHYVLPAVVRFPRADGGDSARLGPFRLPHDP